MQSAEEIADQKARKSRFLNQATTPYSALRRSTDVTDITSHEHATLTFLKWKKGNVEAAITLSQVNAQRQGANLGR